MILVSPNTEYIATTVATRYDLDVISIVDCINAPDGRLFIRLALASSGEVLVKEKAPYLETSEFSVHLGVHRHLQLGEAPVPPLFANNGCAALEICGRLFETQGWIPGSTPYTSPFSMGVALGAIHRGLEGYIGPGTGDWGYPRARKRWFPDRPALVLNYLHFIKELHYRLPGLSILMDELLARTAKLMPAINWDDLPQQWLHGDAGPANAVLVNADKCVLIDFDDARWGYRVWEVAQLAAVFSMLDLGGGSAPLVRTTLDFQKLHSLLAGYHEHASLDANERRAFAPLLTVSSVVATMSELNLDEDWAPGEDAEANLARLCELLDEI